MAKYIDANLLCKEIDNIEEEARKVRVSGTDKEAIGADGKVKLCLKLKAIIDSLQQQIDGILNSYIEQRSKELDAIIQEEMTPDNTVTIADKIGAMTAKNELLRIKELI